MSRFDHEKLAPLLSAVLLAVVFVAGALTGAAVLDSGLAASATPVESAPVPADGAGPLTQLGLSTAQMNTVDSILSTMQPQVDSILQGSMERLRVLMQEADADVRAVLTAEQAATYDALLADRPLVSAVRRTTGPAGSMTVDTIR